MDFEVSVVIPAYNEADCIREVMDRTVAVLRKNCKSFEILIVDDGSEDGTFEEARAICRELPNVRALRLSRNFGHQAALTAGLSEARGQAVITMDADLQHPPELIPDLLEKWRNGAEVVYTVRRDTQGVSFRKNLTARLFYRLLNALSPLYIVPGAADFRLLDRKAADALNRMPERTRFFRGLVPWIGFKQESVSYEAPERFAGGSKYTFRKMARFASHGILSLSAIPLRMAILVGGVVVLVGVLYGLYVVWTALFNPESQKGWASMILVVLLLGGTQIFFMGLIGEYLARVFEEVKGRPLYIVSETVGDEPDKPGNHSD